MSNPANFNLHERTAVFGEKVIDFEHKLGICKKEAGETKYWLRILVHAEPSLKPQAVVLWKEADELRRIFIASIRTSQKAD